MAIIYNHFEDKTLILDSDSNSLIYPLGGELLNWKELRLAFALSVSQGKDGYNSGYSEPEVLECNNFQPISLSYAFGLKNKNQNPHFDISSSFAGITNSFSGDTSTVGFVQSNAYSLNEFNNTYASNGHFKIHNMSKTEYELNINPIYTGNNYLVTEKPNEFHFESPIELNGKTLISGQNLILKYDNINVQVCNDVKDGDSSCFLKTYGGEEYISNGSGICNTLIADENSFKSSISFISNETVFEENILNTSDLFRFQPNEMITTPSNYASVLVLKYQIEDRGTSNQKIKIGYNYYNNISDTSKGRLEELISSMYAIKESQYFDIGTSVIPSCVYIKWPFINTKLRLHSFVVKKMS